MTIALLRITSFLGFTFVLAGCSASGVSVPLGSDAEAETGSRADGGVPADGQADASEGNVARVFVTSAGYAAKSLGGGATGAAGADGFCTNAAEAGSLGGKWVAWLSTSRKNAVERVTGTGPWTLVDGKTLVFPNKASLATVPRVGIGMNELGEQSEVTREVWTGTSNGGVASTFTCDDWTNGTNTGRGMTGIAGQRDEWTKFLESSCDREMSVYCFEVK